MKMNQNGQIIIVLLLTMLVALTIGLGVTQRSVNDISTSTQNEQSTRAFSAAEAGIEAALSNGAAISGLDLGNSSTIVDAKLSGYLPAAGQALEYFPIFRETPVQFWLADPNNLTPYYTGTQVDLYFGTADLTTDLPAMSVNFITRDQGGVYHSYRDFIDTDGSRTVNSNGFTSCGNFTGAINTSNSSDANPANQTRRFKCKVTIPSTPIPSNETPILIRGRILYSSASHPVAVSPRVGSLPPQARIVTSIGLSGQSQKTIQVFNEDKVAPFFFDFAVFSAGNITK